MQPVTHPQILLCAVYPPVVCVPLHVAHWFIYVPPAEDPIHAIRTVTFRSRTGKITFIVVCFLLGNSPASEFYMPTFRHPKESIRHSEHGESLKSRKPSLCSSCSVHSSDHSQGTMPSRTDACKCRN